MNNQKNDKFYDGVETINAQTLPLLAMGSGSGLLNVYPYAAIVPNELLDDDNDLKK